MTRLAVHGGFVLDSFIGKFRFKTLNIEDYNCRVHCWNYESYKKKSGALLKVGTYATKCSFCSIYKMIETISYHLKINFTLVDIEKLSFCELYKYSKAISNRLFFFNCSPNLFFFYFCLKIFKDMLNCTYILSFLLFICESYQKKD